MLKKKAKSAAIVLAYEEEGKVMLLAGVTDDLIKKIKAGDIVKQIAPIVDGGGGGKPQMAQAGGKNPAKIDEALKEAENLIEQKLGGIGSDRVSEGERSMTQKEIIGNKAVEILQTVR